MKTIGDYPVENFEKLKTPIKRSYPLKPFIYKGEIIDYRFNQRVLCYWDEDGKCANYNRSDCYLMIKDLIC